MPTPRIRSADRIRQPVRIVVVREQGVTTSWIGLYLGTRCDQPGADEVGAEDPATPAPPVHEHPGHIGTIHQASRPAQDRPGRAVTASGR
jgi:hypothetical protein